MTHRRTIQFLSCALLAALAACNSEGRFIPSLPGGISIPGVSPSATQAAVTPEPSTPISPQITPTSTAYIIAPQTGLTSECNSAAPGDPIDVTIPDNTSLAPGESFTKTWRLVNTGACTWDDRYAAVWFSGDQFGAPTRIPFSNNIRPGNNADISVDMRAPDAPGEYQSNWKLENPEGELFGIGPVGDAPFWVRIVVESQQASVEEPELVEEPTPFSLVAGMVNIVSGEGLDLDTRRLATGTETDLRYEAAPDGGQQISPANGARIGSFFSEQPDLQDCQSGSLGVESQLVAETTPGSFFCYQTNLGLPGWGRVAGRDDTGSAIAIDLVTWSVP